MSNAALDDVLKELKKIKGSVAHDFIRGYYYLASRQ